MSKKSYKHKLVLKRQRRSNKNEENRAKQSGSNNSNSHDLSPANMLDIGEKQDVAVWNKVFRKHSFGGAESVKIGPLNQNLIREDTDIVIDSANLRDVDIVISGTRITDKIDLSKSQLNHNDNE